MLRPRRPSAPSAGPEHGEWSQAAAHGSAAGGRRLGLRLAPRTMRTRLTLLYGGLFLASGVALLALSVSLWQHTSVSATRVAPAARDLRLPHLPPDQIAPFVAVHQQRIDLHLLLLFSAIAIAVMALVSLGLGWLIAGRVLRPLRTITAAARSISATNLHQRLDLAGPADEMKELGDTFDDLLGRLERSFELQRQFVANASHELRTPLATMRTSLDVAMGKPGPLPPQVVALAGGLRQDLDQADRLLEGLLTLARAQRGPAEAQVTRSLGQMAADAVAACAGAVAEKRLRVEQQGGPPAWVAGSATLLTRMVRNVIDNAVIHNEAGGWIRVRTAAGAGLAHLVVENGGPILDQRQVAELAHPFRRLGTARTGSGRGAGLGLSIVASVAEIHGGRLELLALPAGGLQVRIALPLAAGAPAGAPA